MAAEVSRRVVVVDGQPAGRRGRLDPRGGVDRVAGHHALADRAERHGDLAGDDPAAGLQPGQPSCSPMRGHPVDELQPGPDGALGIGLGGHRRAPHRHDRVADELLDHPAEAPDDGLGQCRVLDRSSRTSSGSRCSLKVVKLTRSTNSTEHIRRSASGRVRIGCDASASPVTTSASLTGVPHVTQKR